jgi:hypothetical protein
MGEVVLQVPVIVRTVTDISERADCRPSLTLTTTAYVPGAAKMWVGAASADVVPSPNSHR